MQINICSLIRMDEHLHAPKANPLQQVACPDANGVQAEGVPVAAP